MAKQDDIQNQLNLFCKEYCFSGYQLYAECKGKTVSLAGGITGYWGTPGAVDDQTFFDLGSVTKVLLTTSVLARLFSQGKIELNHGLGVYIPAFKGSGFDKITLQQLLTHTSGVVWWYPYFEENSGLPTAEWFLAHQKELLVSEPNQKVVYSDPNFWLLGLVIKHFFGSIHGAFEEQVSGPLKLQSIGFGPFAPERCAATEYSLVNRKVNQGEVFDENCAAMGGVAAHAGLFGSAKNLAPWCREWLGASAGKSSWLPKAVADSFTQKAEGAGTRALGWDTKSEVGSSCGDHFSLKSFGHLGFTGTSVWIDPANEAFVIFLTNRVHPSRYDERIRTVRPFIHNELAKLWGMA